MVGLVKVCAAGCLLERDLNSKELFVVPELTDPKFERFGFFFALNGTLELVLFV